MMLDTIPNTFRQIAAHVGVTENTLKRYARTGNAPRSIYYALYWESRWGRSQLEAENHNELMWMAAQLRSLHEHQGRMAGIIWRLEMELSISIGNRAANLPVWRMA